MLPATMPRRALILVLLAFALPANSKTCKQAKKACDKNPAFREAMEDCKRHGPMYYLPVCLVEDDYARHPEKPERYAIFHGSKCNTLSHYQCIRRELGKPERTFGSCENLEEKLQKKYPEWPGLDHMHKIAPFKKLYLTEKKRSGECGPF